MNQFEDYVLTVSWKIGILHCALSLSPSTLCLLLGLLWSHSNIPVSSRVLSRFIKKKEKY